MHADLSHSWRCMTNQDSKGRKLYGFRKLFMFCIHFPCLDAFSFLQWFFDPLLILLRFLLKRQTISLLFRSAHSTVWQTEGQTLKWSKRSMHKSWWAIEQLVPEVFLTPSHEHEFKRFPCESWRSNFLSHFLKPKCILFFHSCQQEKEREFAWRLSIVQICLHAFFFSSRWRFQDFETGSEIHEETCVPSGRIRVFVWRTDLLFDRTFFLSMEHGMRYREWSLRVKNTKPIPEEERLVNHCLSSFHSYPRLSFCFFAWFFRHQSSFMSLHSPDSQRLEALYVALSLILLPSSFHRSSTRETRGFNRYVIYCLCSGHCIWFPALDFNDSFFLFLRLLLFPCWDRSMLLIWLLWNITQRVTCREGWPTAGQTVSWREWDIDPYFETFLVKQTNACSPSLDVIFEELNHESKANVILEGVGGRHTLFGGKFLSKIPVATRLKMSLVY